MFETFHESHERIFGKKAFPKTNMDGINRHQHRLITGEGTVKPKKESSKQSKKKEICPHCATKNLLRVDTWTVKCTKCGFER